MRVALEQREVPDIRLPAKIKEVADNRHQTDQQIKRRVDQHPHLNDPRNAHPHAMQEQQRRKHRRRQIAEPRNEAKDRIEPETEIGSRHPESAVEEDAPFAKRSQGSDVRLMHRRFPFSLFPLCLLPLYSPNSSPTGCRSSM